MPLWQLDEDLFRAVHLGMRALWLDPVMLVLSFSGLGYLQAMGLLIPVLRSRWDQKWLVVVCAAFLAVSFFAERSPLAIVATGVLCGLFWILESRTSWIAILSVIASGVVRLAYVALLPRPRPSNLTFSSPLEDVHAATSFPSGHTTTAFAIAVVVVSHSWNSKRAISVAVLIWAALVGLARVYVGVHYPFDVLAGALLGSGVALVVCSFTNQDRTSPIDRNLE